MKILSLKSCMTLIIFAGLITAGFLTYNHVSAQGVGLVSQTTQSAPGTLGAGTTDATGSQVVVLLRNLSAITLNDAVFRNPAFARLQNQGVGLPAITSQGRRNPFAPTSSSNVIVVPVEETTSSGPLF